MTFVCLSARLLFESADARDLGLMTLFTFSPPPLSFTLPIKPPSWQRMLSSHFHFAVIVMTLICSFPLSKRTVNLFFPLLTCLSLIGSRMDAAKRWRLSVGVAMARKIAQCSQKRKKNKSKACLNFI